MKNGKKALIILGGTLLLVLALGACGLTPPPGTPSTTTLSFNATAPGSLAANLLGRGLESRLATGISLPVEFPAGTVVGTIDFTTVKIALKEFEIEQEGVEADGSSFEFEGPYVVDLVAGSVTPAPAAIEMPSGTYTQLKFKIDKIEGNESDEDGTQLVAARDPLFGKSIILEGSFTPTGGSAVAFSYSYSLDAEFELSNASPTGFEISAELSNSIVVAFRLHKWFDGINPALFAANPGSYAELLKENIKASADYGRDNDGDGNLESNEDDDPDTEDTQDD